MPVLPDALVCASRLLTVNVALPLRLRVVSSAMASALTVTTSALPLAAIVVVLLLPVVMPIALSEALPVLIVSDPEVPVA